MANYYAYKNAADGSCIAPFTGSGVPTLGCMDPKAVNYNSNADTDDGSCLYAIGGCTDAIQYVYSVPDWVDNVNYNTAGAEFLADGTTPNPGYTGITDLSPNNANCVPENQN